MDYRDNVYEVAITFTADDVPPDEMFDEIEAYMQLRFPGFSGVVSRRTVEDRI